MGKKNAAMVDREDKSTQTTEIFVGKISGRKHGIVGNVLDNILQFLVLQNLRRNDINEILLLTLFLFKGNHNKGNVPAGNAVKERIKVVVSAPSYVSQTIKNKGEVFRSRIGKK